MADVWLAEDQELGRKVAVKILHERYANDEQFVERFRREATHAAGLSHPNIVSIFDRGEADGSYFIVMEYVEGRTLKELIVTRGPCPVPVAISYVAAGARRAPLRAPQRDRPPRHQAAQRDRRPRGARQGRRLRHRARRREPDDRGRLDHRHRAVPLARAGARRAGRRELRPLLDRDRALRAAHRHGAVHRRDAGRDRDEAPLPGARRALGGCARDSARPRPRRPARAREGAGRPVPLRRRRWIATSSSSRAARPSGRRPRTRRRWCSRGRDDRRDDRRGRRGRRTAATSATAPTTAEVRTRPLHGGRGCSRSARAIALGVGGWLLYDNVQDADRRQQAGRASTTTRASSRRTRGRPRSTSDGFEPNVRRLPNGEVAARVRLRAGARPGDAACAKGSIVTILVSTGKPKVTVPLVVGKRRDAAPWRSSPRAGSTRASSRSTPTAVGHRDRRRTRAPGTVLVEGSSVRINVSKGPKPVAVPTVVGLTYDVAAAQLQSAGFAVAGSTSSSDQPGRRGRRRRSPPGNSTASKGSSVTLSVSKGPTTVTVPDVLAADRRPTPRRRSAPPASG